MAYHTVAIMPDLEPDPSQRKKADYALAILLGIFYDPLVIPAKPASQRPIDLYSPFHFPLYPGIIGLSMSFQIVRIRA